MLKGIGSTFFASGYVALTQVALLAFSARYLSSVELGWVSIGSAILAFSNVFIDSGIGTYIIYRRNLKRKELNSLLLCSMFLSMLAYLLIVVLSEPIEIFFDSSGLSEILHLYALLLLLSPFMSQFQALLVLEQKLTVLGVIDVITKTVGVLLSVMLLAFDFGVSAIISGLLTSMLLKSIMMQFSLKDEFKAKFSGLDWSVVPMAFQYCKYQIGGQLLNFARMYIDTIIIGKMFDMSQLGLYSLAKELVGKIPALLSPIYGKTIFPVMTRIKEDVSLRSILYKGVNLLVTYINAVVFSSVALFADIIVTVLYGESENIVKYIQILCVFFMVRGCGVINGFFLQSLGKVRREFFWNLFSSIFFSAGIYTFSMYGMSTMLWGMVGVQTLFLSLSFIVFHYPNYPVNILNYFCSTLTLIASGCFVVIVVLFYDHRLNVELSIISTLLTVISLSILVFSLVGGRKSLYSLRDI
ncbi:oligosaccharide flippase family protein, partial [Vibrio sp. M260118]|uniref:oligosaccharide flippase family protein n=1 Tax=Vibrio sp. M260118 TaxID=3020896 RepID=UPI002F40E070